MDAHGWDERYAAGQVWSVEPNRFFAEAVRSLAVTPGRAIDVACGEGRNAVWLAENGWSVTAVDFSAVGIERGRELARERGVGVEWVVADLQSWDLGVRSWDLVAHVYLHWPAVEREPFLRRVVDAVAPGGHLVVVGHDRTNVEHGHGGPQNPDVLTTPDELAGRFAAAGLDVCDARLAYRPVTLEPGHGAPADLAQPAVVEAIDHVVIARRPS
jgi:SAM-dependent methyltransferase